jgi:hypothetical protein
MQEKPRAEWRAQARADLLTWVSYIVLYRDSPELIEIVALVHARKL